MMAVHYQYQPLENDSTIRILSLDPGENDDLLTGRLDAVSINSTGVYEALSYVWADPGPPDCPYEILLRDGCHTGLLVLRGGSIFAALHRLRRPNRSRRIWLDQCCINQDDASERGEQVKFMNRIYHDAAHVLVWLGLDTQNEARAAFSLIHDLDQALADPPIRTSYHNGRPVDLENHVRDNQKALRNLTSRPWVSITGDLKSGVGTPRAVVSSDPGRMLRDTQFTRGWIVQEIGTSTPATMIWGNETIEWLTLASVCERLKRHHDLRSTLKIATSDISFLFRRFVEPGEGTHHTNRLNFIYELQRARHLRFTDDRDRIFAFLGHFSVCSLHVLGCGPVHMVADYTKSVEQTYLDLALQILQESPTGAFALLTAVHHPRYNLPSQDGSAKTSLDTWCRGSQTLPSWVPDWRCRWPKGIILGEPICPHRAHGESTTSLEVIVSDTHAHVLRTRGIGLDTISLCSQVLLSSDFYRKHSLDQHPTTIQRLWQEICGKTRFDFVDRYLDGQTAFFAFMQTLSNGCVQAAGHEGRPYHEIPDRVWLQMAARYVVQIMGLSDIVSDEVKTVAEETAEELGHEQWSRWATSATEGRIFARTQKGYYVLGPTAMEEGDVVCVLSGSKMPFCLRPMGGFYLLVGECYVHGVMKGEAMQPSYRRLYQITDTVFDII